MHICSPLGAQQIPTVTFIIVTRVDSDLLAVQHVPSGACVGKALSLTQGPLSGPPSCAQHPLPPNTGRPSSTVATRVAATQTALHPDCPQLRVRDEQQQHNKQVAGGWGGRVEPSRRMEGGGGGGGGGVG